MTLELADAADRRFSFAISIEAEAGKGLLRVGLDGAGGIGEWLSIHKRIRSGFWLI